MFEELVVCVIEGRKIVAEEDVEEVKNRLPFLWNSCPGMTVC